ncbi:hypothetical protein ACHAQD_011481 [Fusarium lateritium]
MSISPFEWPLWWRICILLNVSFYNLLGNAWCSGLAPIFGLIIQELYCSQTQASDLNTYALLTLGLSNLFALPLSMLIGKRFTVLGSLVVFIACNIWSGEATDYYSLRDSRIVGGLAGGLVEALGPTIVAETFPSHQLGRAMVVYVGFLAAGSSVGPLVAGAVGVGLGSWRWYLRILLGSKRASDLGRHGSKADDLFDRGYSHFISGRNNNYDSLFPSLWKGMVFEVFHQ